MSMKTKIKAGILKLTQFPVMPKDPKTDKWYGI